MDFLPNLFMDGEFWYLLRAQVPLVREREKKERRKRERRERERTRKRKKGENNAPNSYYYLGLVEENIQTRICYFKEILFIGIIFGIYLLCLFFNRILIFRWFLYLYCYYYIVWLYLMFLRLSLKTCGLKRDTSFYSILSAR
jgi:hypothetical protein